MDLHLFIAIYHFVGRLLFPVCWAFAVEIMFEVDMCNATSGPFIFSKYYLHAQYKIHWSNPFSHVKHEFSPFSQPELCVSVCVHMSRVRVCWTTDTHRIVVVHHAHSHVEQRNDPSPLSFSAHKTFIRHIIFMKSNWLEYQKRLLVFAISSVCVRRCLARMGFSYWMCGTASVYYLRFQWDKLVWTYSLHIKQIIGHSEYTWFYSMYYDQVNILQSRV